ADSFTVSAAYVKHPKVTVWIA
ncbi:MAG: hypothetical protein QOJ08_460, partial [Ilumatobacteraceae bacterium]